MRRTTGARRGIIFVSLLAVLVVVSMLTAAFLKRSQNGLFRSANYRNGVAAEQAARGGANHVLGLLAEDKTFHATLNERLGTDASYTVTFDPTQPYFSVNNLGHSTVSDQLSYQGYKVAPNSADIIVVGTQGLSRRIIRVVVQKGVDSLRSVAAVGRVTLSGDVRVEGVKSLTAPPGHDEPEPAPGGIMSKYRTSQADQQAIAWSDGTTFQLSDLSRLETAPAQSGLESVSANLRTQYPDQIIDQGAGDTIPDIDVVSKVTSGMSSPPLAGGSVQNGYVFVSDARSVSGDLLVNGDLVLSEGTVFVDGDLTVNGGIQGLGSIYVRGNVTVKGGNSIVQTSQPAGAALMAGGDITLQGQDALGFLTTLAAGNPDVASAFTGPDGLQAHLTAYQNLPNNDFLLYAEARSLSKHVDVTISTPLWVNPIPGPGGGHVVGTTNGVIPRLVMAVKASGATGPAADKVVRALEQMAFHFRDNDRSLPLTNASGTQVYTIDGNYALVDAVAGGLLSPTAVQGLLGGAVAQAWDDDELPDTGRTHSSIAYGSPAVTGDRNALSDARRDAYLRYNPLDFSWLGESSFQGLVYARGNISADTRFKVVGSLVSLGDVNLTNGSTLIFNEEYRSLFGDELPVGVVHFEEL